MLGAVKLTKSVDKDKYEFSSYSIGFDSSSEFSLPDGSVNKNVIIFGAECILILKENILILGKSPTQYSLHYMVLHLQHKLNILLILL